MKTSPNPNHLDFTILVETIQVVSYLLFCILNVGQTQSSKSPKRLQEENRH